MLLKTFGFASFVLLAYTANIKADINEDKLLSTLFNDYESRARPSQVYTLPTTIYTSLILNQVIDVHEPTQILSTCVVLVLQWYDLRLAWNPSNYSGLGRVTVPAENVWRPDLSLFNGAEKFDFQSDYQYVVISNTGLVVWAPNGEIKTQCTLDVKYFPFDVQNCSISISSTTLLLDQIDFVVIADVILDYYLPNTEWTLKNNSHSKIIKTKPFPVAIVTFHLILERKPLFILFNLIFPCVIILTVAFLAFLVPIQSGEKMSIGITTLLSIVVLLLVIADQLPPTSDSIPLISLFYAASTLIIAFICLMSVFILNIHHYGELGKPVPMLLQRIFFTIIARIILFPRVLDLNAIHSKQARKQGSINCRYCCTLMFKKRQVSPANDVVGDETFDIIEKDVIQLQWTLLADIFDRFIFYILLFATIFILLGIIGQAPNASIF